MSDDSRSDPIAVRCSALRRDFGEGSARTTVLHGLDLQIACGERVFLVGPSGCGKTTLVSLIAGLLTPTSGRVEILGQDLTVLRGDALVRFRARHIGFVFQQFNLIPALNALENVSVPLLLLGTSRREAHERAEAVLVRLGMQAHLAKHPVQLSGGQQQRIAVARSLVHDPRLLICDEPTASLDAQSGQTVMSLLHEVAESPTRAVIVVTHDNRILQYATRIVHLSDGRIVTPPPHETDTPTNRGACR